MYQEVKKVHLSSNSIASWLVVKSLHLLSILPAPFPFSLLSPLMPWNCFWALLLRHMPNKQRLPTKTDYKITFKSSKLPTRSIPERKLVRNAQNESIGKIYHAITNRTTTKKCVVKLISK